MEITGIKPVYSVDLFDCAEGCSITVLNWLGKSDYRHMYNQSWGFELIKEKDRKGFSWIVRDGKRNINENLAKYYGLKTTYITKTSMEDCWKSVRASLKNNMPAGIGVDMYNMPWLKNFYKKTHSGRAVLVTDIDEENELLICVDVEDHIDRVELPFHEFEEGCISYGTFEIVEDFTEPETDYYSILKNGAQSVLEPMDGQNCIDKIKFLSDEIVTSLDLKAESEGYVNPADAPLMLSMLNLSRCRKNYSNVLKLISEHSDYSWLSPLSERLFTAGEMWVKVMRTLTKGAFMPDATLLLKRASSYIKDLSVEEEDIAKEILKGLGL